MKPAWSWPSLAPVPWGPGDIGGSPAGQRVGGVDAGRGIPEGPGIDRTAANLALAAAKGKRLFRHGETPAPGIPGQVRRGFASLPGAAESHPGPMFHPTKP